MNKHLFMGVPTPISHHRQIVLDKAFRIFYGLSPSGGVRWSLDGPFVRIYPPDFPAPGSFLKHLNHGRFHLPAEWIRQYADPNCQTVYLIPTLTGLAVSAAEFCPRRDFAEQEWIVGFPLKLSGTFCVNLPAAYLNAYGIPPGRCRIYVEEAFHKLFLRPAAGRTRKEETIQFLSGRKLMLPREWRQKHRLKPGDVLFLLGLPDGLLLHTAAIGLCGRH